VELSELSTRRFLMIEILAGALYVDAYLFAFGGLMIGAFTTLYGLTAIKPEDLDKRIPPISDVLPRRRCARFGPQLRSRQKREKHRDSGCSRDYRRKPAGNCAEQGLFGGKNSEERTILEPLIREPNGAIRSKGHRERCESHEVETLIEGSSPDSHGLRKPGSLR
jgi:hypothetical protein